MTTNSAEVIIDCDKEPRILNDSYMPNDYKSWKVESHQRGGQLKWHSSLIKLYTPAFFKEHHFIRGGQLRKEFMDRQALNANVLDFLLENEHLIPDSWDKNYVCRVIFGGTIFLNSKNHSFVRFLYRNSTCSVWDWSYDLIEPDSIWHNECAIAVRR